MPYGSVAVFVVRPASGAYLCGMPIYRSSRKQQLVFLFYLSTSRPICQDIRRYYLPEMPQSLGLRTEIRTPERDPTLSRISEISHPQHVFSLTGMPTSQSTCSAIHLPENPSRISNYDRYAISPF